MRFEVAVVGLMLDQLRRAGLTEARFSAASWIARCLLSKTWRLSVCDKDFYTQQMTLMMMISLRIWTKKVRRAKSKVETAIY